MTDPNPAELAHAAATIAREAGALIRERYDAPRQVRTKSAVVDLVTDTDRAAEGLILDRLRATFPEHAVMSEETGAIAATGVDRASICWVIDPLDGTTNFAHGVPHFAVSIAAVRAPGAGSGGIRDLRSARTIAGVVYDPMRDELFVASEDGPALLGGQPIGVTSADAVEVSLLATGFPYDRRERLDGYLAYWHLLMLRARDIRRMGAAALDLAWVACGRLDGFWEWRLQPWDVAAGSLLVQRAGGRVTDFSGAEPGLDATQTLATNGAIHRELLAAIAPLLAENA